MCALRVWAMRPEPKSAAAMREVQHHSSFVRNEHEPIIVLLPRWTSQSSWRSLQFGRESGETCSRAYAKWWWLSAGRQRVAEHSCRVAISCHPLLLVAAHGRSGVTVMRKSDASTSAPSSGPESLQPALVHLSGRRRGTNRFLTGERITVGYCRYLRRLRYPPRRPPSGSGHCRGSERTPAGRAAPAGRDAPARDRVRRTGVDQLWINGERVDRLVLASADVIELGDDRDVLRFRLYPSDRAPYKSMSEAFSDCMECARQGSARFRGQGRYLPDTSTSRARHADDATGPPDLRRDPAVPGGIDGHAAVSGPAVTDSSVVYDAETTSGGSGGPLLDLQGRVVAINSEMIREFGGSNLGVPASRARELLQDRR